MNPKVLVGCPTYDGKKYCLKEYAEALKKLTYDNFDVAPFVPVAMGDNIDFLYIAMKPMFALYIGFFSQIISGLTYQKTDETLLLVKPPGLIGYVS